MASTNTDDDHQQPQTLLAQFHTEFQEKLNEMRTPMGLPGGPGANPQSDDYNVLDEVKRIHQIIKAHGQQGEFAMEIKFGDLIPLYGIDQVDRLIEVLAIGRKNGYLNYTLKDFFQQDRDEHIAIRLIKTRW